MSEHYYTRVRRNRFYTTPTEFNVSPKSYNAVLTHGDDGVCVCAFTLAGITQYSKITASFAQNSVALGTLFISSQVDNNNGTGTCTIQSSADEITDKNIIVTVQTL